MKFQNIPYQRPDFQLIKTQFEALLSRFEKADDAAVGDVVLKEINALRNDFDTLKNIASIRHTIDTKDAFYKAENDFFDEVSPELEDYISRFYTKLLRSPHRRELEAEWGKQLFTIAELSVKTVNSTVINELKHENHLVSEYVMLCASAKIMFEGEERNLSGLSPFMQAPDRDMRRRAAVAYWGFFEQNKEKFDELYDELVKLRTKIAHKLGYANFVQLGYDRMLRSDYGPIHAERFRELIHRFIVPVAQRFRRRQAQRIGVDKLKYYDHAFSFPSGNATPKGDATWILQHGKQMYEQLSPETAAFFDYMVNTNLMDLENKKGKAGGGYCTYLANYKAPFIFSNFNGTSHDIDVLTHEAGHAFQVYESRNFQLPEYSWPTHEACEIHSMSMEFLTYPWMENFFQEDTRKYKYTHLTEGIIFLPYGVSVDEFQHVVYENPDFTPQQRKEAWLEIEKKYLPWVDYDGIEFLEQGGFWQRQAHIYEMPFYYIDYTLAQMCAFQFLKKSTDNRSEAFNDYLRLCRAGGSKPFLELVKYANLKSPFKAETFQSVLENVENYLQEVDDRYL